MYQQQDSDIVNIMSFADAIHSEDGSQLCYTIVIMCGGKTGQCIKIAELGFAQVSATSEIDSCSRTYGD